MNQEKLIQILDRIYLSVLGRSVDKSGIETYLPKLKENIHNGKIWITNDLYTSEEYKKLNIDNIDNGFNSLAGDRISYINNNDTKTLDSSKYKDILNTILKYIVLNENENYPTDKLEDRIHTIKKSLINIGNNNLPFTIFPHLEYDFNTDRFNESLKVWKNLQYFILYMCVANIWKDIFNKTVDTCGTKFFVSRLAQIKSNDLEEIINAVNYFIVDYLSIKICGRLLSQEENNEFCKAISSKNSNKAICYLENLVSEEIATETITASTYLKSLKQKPKVLVMIAYLENQNQYFLEKMMYHAKQLIQANPYINFEFAFDNERVGKEPGDYTPWSRVKRIRNLMINKYSIRNYDYLYVIDSDIIDYPHNFPTRAIGLNPNGITAPMALIQNSVIFYDWCGYQKKGNTSLYGKYGKFIKNLSVKERNFNLRPPYVDNDLSRLTEIDCVGCTYIVPTKVFDQTYGDLQKELIDTFNIAGVKNHKIADNIVQYEDHPCFTDHFTICAAVRANGGKIYMDRGSAAYHADLPIHGEGWH
jgi:hypothetical protein